MLHGYGHLVYRHVVYRMDACASTFGAIEVVAILAANRDMSVVHRGSPRD